MTTGLPEGGDTTVKTMLLSTAGWVGVVEQQETATPGSFAHRNRRSASERIRSSERPGLRLTERVACP